MVGRLLHVVLPAIRIESDHDASLAAGPPSDVGIELIRRHTLFMKEALHAVLKKARGFRQVKWKKRRAELERLEAKHGRDRSLARGFPELSVKRTHPSLSDGFAPVQSVARRAPQDHGLIVDTLHKQGMMVLAKSELPWAGGKKS